jgi:hypothetical protein
MKKKYEAPELTLIGQANDIVMGSGSWSSSRHTPVHSLVLQRS